MSWGQMKVWCLCAVWSSVLGLTNFSLDEGCVGGDDECEWGEKWKRWDGCDDDVGFDVLSVPSLIGIDSKTRGSSLNVMLFLIFCLRSWKESTSLFLVSFFAFALGGSWNEDPLWQSGFKWARFLLYFFPFGPLMIYERPCLSISLTVPVNHFNFMPYCFCGKNLTCSFTLRTCLSLALWARSKCSFWVFWISSKRQHIFWMLMGLWHRGMTAPCVGCPCNISAGDGKSAATCIS